MAQACVAPEKIDKTMSKTMVCFVCAGNTCRSPMAAAVYNDLHQGEPTFAISRGVAAHQGCPIHPLAVAALEAAGIQSTPENNYRAHLSHMLTDDDVESAEVIYCLTPEIGMAVLCDFPFAIRKIRSMGYIADPWGGDLTTYQNTLREIIGVLS